MVLRAALQIQAMTFAVQLASGAIALSAAALLAAGLWAESHRAPDQP